MRHISAAALAVAATVLFFLPAQAGAKTALVELRVEGPGQTLDPGTWYVTGNERIRKSKPSDACNRAKGRIAVAGPTPLSLAQSGSASNRDLRQVRVRRDEAGLFTCEIGSILGRPFGDPDGFAGWSYYENYVFGSAAADQLKLRNNDRILWVFSDFGATTPANQGPALELRRVPARTEGTFTARVVEHGFDGGTSPATGATIEGAESVNELGGGTLRGDGRQRQLDPHARPARSTSRRTRSRRARSRSSRSARRPTARRSSAPAEATSSRAPAGGTTSRRAAAAT